MDITDFRENRKTAYLAAEYDRLSEELQRVDELARKDPALAELASEERTAFAKQQEELLAQMEAILTPAGVEEGEAIAVVMEFRAGAGGNEA
ncbi:MAG: PCRF domain-containing protein, partial [Patescibacteria group bacterium]